MKTVGSRVSVILCVVNLLGFSAFILAREPYIHLGQELEVSRQTGEWMGSYYSGQPLTHIAGRPLYSWNDWHGNEATWVKVLEIANFPALILAHGLAEPMTMLLFPGSGSYYLQSWVKAWSFTLLAIFQWFTVGWLIDAVNRLAELRSLDTSNPRRSDKSS